MADDIYAVITRVDSPRDGWYEAQPSINEPSITGVSIKGTALSVGQKVRVVQSGNWYGTLKGWAFAALDEGIGSVIQSSRSLPGIAEQNRAGASLAYLFHKSGNVREEYHPATITAISGDTLTLKDWHSGKAMGEWPVVSGLGASMFAVGESVLCRMIPDQIRAVVGWWETAPTRFIPGLVQIGGSGTPVPVIYNTATHTFVNETEHVPRPNWNPDSSLPRPEDDTTALIRWRTGETSLYTSGTTPTRGYVYAAREGRPTIDFESFNGRPTLEVISFDGDLPASNFELIGTFDASHFPTERDFMVLFRRSKSLDMRFLFTLNVAYVAQD